MDIDIINFLRDWFGPLPWVEILAASGSLSAALLAVRKWRLYKKIDSWFSKEWFTDAMVLSLGFGEAIVSWLVSANFDNPKLVAFQGAIQVFTMNRLYIWILKPWYNRLKTRLLPKIERARQINASIQAERAMPIPGAPPPQPAVQPQDFSK